MWEAPTGYSIAPEGTLWAYVKRCHMAHDHPEHTVRARFGGLEPARRAIAALERAGVPGSDIELEGLLAEKAAVQQDTSVSDEAFMQVAAKTVFGGAAIGAGVRSSVWSLDWLSWTRRGSR